MTVNLLLSVIVGQPPCSGVRQRNFDYQKKLGAFLDQFWDYYAKLCDFKMKPDAEVAKQLDIEFDQLFSTETVMINSMIESVRPERRRKVC